MKYKVTKHYLKTKENLIAAFADFNDVHNFIAIKQTHDEINRNKVLYRVYDENELVQEFNNGIQSLIDFEDAETYSNARFSFTVKMQSAQSLERIIVACFNDKKDANLFVSDKCSREDVSDSGKTFLIFKDQILLTTLNRNIMANKVLKEFDTSGKGTGATLSPLSRRPTPSGGPGDYWVDKNDDNE